MEIQDVLKIQNRYLDTQLQTESIKALRQFNDELIESIEFKQWNPTLFSEEITRLFVLNGFYHMGQSMGKSWSSYHHKEHRCFFRYNNDRLEWDKKSILFVHKNGQILIEDASKITAEYLNELIEIAK